MAGVILEPITSPEAIMRNLQRLNEAVVALQGGKIAMENIVGYEDLATKSLVEEAEAKMEKMKIPVGGRYYSSSSTDPADFFGYGTWQLVGAGRVEIGVGEATDSREEKKAFKGGEIGGEFDHQLTEGELPAHEHTISNREWAVGGGDDVHKVWNDYGGSSATQITNKTGGDDAHNNMQPYEVIYKWERTE